MNNFDPVAVVSSVAEELVKQELHVLRAYLKLHLTPFAPDRSSDF